MVENILDYPLIKFSENPVDWWTIRNAVTGVQIFGGIGSGKSSGSGKTLAYSFLKNDFGGIILTGKVDETETWLRYARDTDRLDDVIIFGAHRDNLPNNDEFKHLRNKGYKFNPLSYLGQSGNSGSSDNIVSLFTSIIQAGDRIEGTGGETKQDAFWGRALKRLMKAAIDLLKLAELGKSPGDNFDLTIPNIIRVIQDTPISDQDLPEYCYTFDCLASAGEAISNGGHDHLKNTFGVVENYFTRDFRYMPEKTRGNILETFYGFANAFMSGMLADYFAEDVSEEIKPEATFGTSEQRGKIIILDFPVKEFLQSGIYAQAIYKRLWQIAVEKRDVAFDTNPVFMWVDEAQFFLSEEDMLFQTTARSSRACTVMISQNISNYYATIGGNNAVQRVNSLLGNLSTKIFHANNDYVTNQWAANTIGKTFQSQMSVSVGGDSSTSLSKSLNYQVEPQAFTILRNGGPLNRNQVDGIVTVSGKQWSNGLNYLRTYFYQED